MRGESQHTKGQGTGCCSSPKRPSQHIDFFHYLDVDHLIYGVTRLQQLTSKPKHLRCGVIHQRSLSRPKLLFCAALVTFFGLFLGLGGRGSDLTVWWFLKRVTVRRIVLVVQSKSRASCVAETPATRAARIAARSLGVSSLRLPLAFLVLLPAKTR